MSVFICKMCGAPLNVSEGKKVCECSYCGTSQTISGHRDEVHINMFNRANDLRIKSDFDRAYAQFEKLVQECPDDAESYWGLLLSRFGVEYVKDPATGKMIPTLHRTQLTPVSTDPDYRLVLEYADSAQREIYEKEAGEIDRLQKEILAVAQNEAPFDVFICYKEKDENDSRTKDSLIANDIYSQLTQEGLKVFYAAITLEDKIGQEYEPYIYAALHSAKVMLVIGTRPEFFEAVWVRNEWSRYLKLVQADRSRLLIPCYRDMNPYDLPAEFSHLQAQDMSKIGFTSDIIRGIRKALNIPAPSISSGSEKEADDEKAESKTEAFLKKGYLSLKDKNWEMAEKYFECALDEDAREVRAYIGLLCREFAVTEEESLVTYGNRISASLNYKRACRFASPEVSDRLYSYVSKYEYNKNLARYNALVSEMKQTTESSGFEELEPKFRELGDFEDAAKKADECHRYAEEFLYNESLVRFDKYVNEMRDVASSKDFHNLKDDFLRIVNFRDSKQKAEECVRYAKEALDREYWEHIRNCKKGDIVEFGNYEWYVIGENQNMKTLFSKAILTERVFHEKKTIMTWKHSDLRKWLNEVFINWFPPEEKKMICKTKIDTPNNPKYRTPGGGRTEDYVYLLSIEEAEKLDDDIMEIGADWWLRSPGADMKALSYWKTYFEAISYEGGSPTYSFGVRPVINIKTD